eukprot:Clim_evm98s152 gene=Clim_evmTU98s152
MGTEDNDVLSSDVERMMYFNQYLLDVTISKIEAQGLTMYQARATVKESFRKAAIFQSVCNARERDYRLGFESSPAMLVESESLTPNRLQHLRNAKSTDIESGSLDSCSFLGTLATFHEMPVETSIDFAVEHSDTAGTTGSVAATAMVTRQGIANAAKSARPAKNKKTTITPTDHAVISTEAKQSTNDDDEELSPAETVGDNDALETDDLTAVEMSVEPMSSVSLADAVENENDGLEALLFDGVYSGDNDVSKRRRLW